jgi:hypothetical protein
MGLHIRDDRQMKALTGLSPDQFDHLRSGFSDLYRATQQQRYEAGSPPARAGVTLAVAPKANCQPWRRNDHWSSTMIKRILRLMS